MSETGPESWWEPWAESWSESGLFTGICTAWDIDDRCCDIPKDMPPDRVEQWKLVASELLWRASGMRYGPSCPVTVRPCGRDCFEELIPYQTWGVQQTGGRIPYTVDGRWFNFVGCGCKTDCGCEQLCEIRLDGPVHDILEVKVDGKPLPPESYRVDAPNKLVRLDGDCWAACQDLHAPDTEKNTASVTYRTGVPLDATARMAVSALWCALVKADKCGGGCGECGECAAMAKGVTKVTRQGVSYDFSDEREGRPETPAGFVMPDIAQAWISLINPSGLSRPARVYSPDMKRHRVVPQWGYR